MHDDELVRFKLDVNLVQLAVERYGYQRDRTKSTRSSHVLAHPTTGDKVVARVDRDGHWTYFSVRADHDNGSVIDFVLHRLTSRSLGEVRKELRTWLGQPTRERDTWTTPWRHAPTPDPLAVVRAYGEARDAETCPYLELRGLPRQLTGSRRFVRTWRVSPRGHVLFPHKDDTGAMTGFEIKDHGVTRFATGGTKSAWQSHCRAIDRAVVVAESAIDALSYAALHGDGDCSRYVSTGGAPGSRQLEILGRLFARMPAGATIVAAVDRDAGGDRISRQLEALTRSLSSLSFRRHSPEHDKDWNDVLQRSLERGRTPDLGR